MLQCTDNFQSFYLEIFSYHTLWLSLCSKVLRFLIVQWLPFHSTTVLSGFRLPLLFLEEKCLSSFLNLSWRVRLPYLEIMVCWLIYHNGWANKKSWIAFSSDPVFNKQRIVHERAEICNFPFIIQLDISRFERKKFHISKQPCSFVSYLSTLLTRRGRRLNSRLKKRTRCHSFMALNRASDI